MRRLKRYREAGADCLYAPGLRTAEEIGRLVEEVDGPVNVLAGAGLTVNELAALGVKRISVGGSLARASLAVVKRAAAEMAGPGAFTFAADAIPDAELCAFLAGEQSGGES